MKNRLIVFFCFISICMVAFAVQIPSGKYQNYPADEDLKGPVKSCTEFFYATYKPGENIDSDYDYQLREAFDIRSKELSAIMSGNPSKKPIAQSLGFFPSYDDKGRITTTKDQSGEIIGFSVYTTNKENNLVERFSTRPNSAVMLKIIYNKNGSRDTTYNYYANGKFMGKAIYHYNKNKDLIELEELCLDKDLSYKTVFSYDKNHHKTEEIRYDAKNTSGSRKNYGYDKYGNMILERDTITDIYIGGNRIFSIDPANKNYVIFKCKYGNFDNHNNWLREDMFHNDTIAKTFKRVIEYYH